MSEYESTFAVVKKECQDLSVELQKTKEEFTAIERRAIKLQVIRVEVVVVAVGGGGGTRIGAKSFESSRLLAMAIRGVVVTCESDDGVDRRMRSISRPR